MFMDGLSDSLNNILYILWNILIAILVFFSKKDFGTYIYNLLITLKYFY